MGKDAVQSVEKHIAHKAEFNRIGDEDMGVFEGTYMGTKEGRVTRLTLDCS